MFKNFQKKLLLILFIILLSIIGYLTWTPNPEQTAEETDPNLCEGSKVREMARGLKTSLTPKEDYEKYLKDSCVQQYQEAFNDEFNRNALCRLLEDGSKEPKEIIEYLKKQTSLSEWENKKICEMPYENYFYTLKKFEIDWTNVESEQTDSIITIKTYSKIDNKNKIKGPIFTFEKWGDGLWRLNPEYQYPVKLFSMKTKMLESIKKEVDNDGYSHFIFSDHFVVTNVTEIIEDVGILAGGIPPDDLKNINKFLYFSDGSVENFPSIFQNLYDQNTELPFLRSLNPMKIKSDYTNSSWLIVGNVEKDKIKDIFKIDRMNIDVPEKKCSNLKIDDPTEYKTYTSKLLGITFYSADGGCTDPGKSNKTSFGIIDKNDQCIELDSGESNCNDDEDYYGATELQFIYNLENNFFLGYLAHSEDGEYIIFRQFDPKTQTFIQREKSKE